MEDIRRILKEIPTYDMPIIQKPSSLRIDPFLELQRKKVRFAIVRTRKTLEKNSVLFLAFCASRSQRRLLLGATPLLVRRVQILDETDGMIDIFDGFRTRHRRRRRQSIAFAERSPQFVHYFGGDQLAAVRGD